MKFKIIKTIKQLKKKCEQLWKKACFKRDGRECQVKRFYPEIPLMHTDTLQVDHCFSRADKNLFLEMSNGTVVCSGCNFKHNKKARLLIQKIVQQREGFERYAQMEATYLTLKGNPNFSKRWWLEQKLKELK